MSVFSTANHALLAKITLGSVPGDMVYYRDSAMGGSGFLLLAQGLSLGRSRIVAFAHSTVSGEFHARSVTVNVIGSSEAIMQIDIAQTTQLSDGSCCTLRLIGWAVDRRATTGSGIAAVIVWAYPEDGSAPFFVLAPIQISSAM